MDKKTKYLETLLLFTVCVTLTAGQSVLQLSILNTTVCPASNYFDSTYLNCNACPANESPVGNQTSCACTNGTFSANASAIGFKTGCTTCPTGSAPSANGARCVLCPTTVNTVTGDCTCALGSVPIDVDSTGTFLTTKVCVACNVIGATGLAVVLPTNTVRYTSCPVCPYGMYYDNVTAIACVCNTTAGQFQSAAGNCVLGSDVNSTTSAYPLSTAYAFTYFDINDPSQGATSTFDLPQSATISYFYNKVAVGCVVYGDPQSCQSLANLCVLVLYNEQQTICKLYQAQMTKIGSYLQIDSGWRAGLPWLYYSSTAANTLYNTYIAMQVTFGNDNLYTRNTLDYWLAKYDIYGNYYGFEPLSNQLLLCPNSVASGQSLKSFGTTFTNNCNLNLQSFMNAQTWFYELFLKDIDGSYKPIPVLITNIRDVNRGAPNQGSNQNNWRFVRRFFVVDSISGLAGQGVFPGTQNTTVLRFAQSMTLNVGLLGDGSQRISLPYLTITYMERKATSIVNNPTSAIAFNTQYTMDTTSFWYNTKALFITCNIVVGIITLFRAYIWSKAHSQKSAQDMYISWTITETFILLIKTWGDIMFFFLLFLTGYWFIFFKMQNQVFCLIPSDQTSSDYSGFKTVFGIMVGCQFVSILDMIRRQCNVDIILLDWEKPKMFVKKDPESPPMPMVSGWRTLFLCNEMNERQSGRYISFEFLMILFAFLMKGVNLEQLSLATPYMDLTVTGVPENVVLKYFLTTFLLFIIGAFLLVCRRAVTLWFPSSVQTFTDLCSFANISIFLLDDVQHGYYIHGISPGGSAEGSVEYLRMCLDQEGKGHGRSRGMIANDQSSLQTYEVYIPLDMRMKYNGIFKYHVDREVADKKRIQEMSNPNLIKGIGKALPEGFDFEFIERKRLELHQILKIYIEGVVAESQTQIREKSIFERLFDYPPLDLERMGGNPVFYKDPSYGYQSIMFYGKDLSLLLWNIAVYQIFDTATGSTLISIALAYIFEKLFVGLRNYFGERNLSQKTLVDDAFLV
jgi:meckelin